MPRLLVALTAHGFGHLGQTAPVLNRLGELQPDLELTLATTLSEPVLARTLRVPWRRVERALDVGLKSMDALTVDVESSREAYRSFHRRYLEELEEDRAWLRELAPDLVLCNVPYRPARAARELAIPCLGMSSLNWADVAGAYLGPEEWVQEAREAYAGLDLFLQLEPSMPMGDLPRRLGLGLVARRGRNLRSELGFSPEDRLVLVALGGVPLDAPDWEWPRLDRVVWLLPEYWPAHGPHTRTQERLPAAFVDLVASSDLMITKTGYGSFAEAAAHGLPVLSFRRPDWPEEPYLWGYLERRGGLKELTLEEWRRGTFADEVAQLLQGPRPEPIEPVGVDQAVDALMAALAARR